MQAKDFLASVLPSDGYITVARPIVVSPTQTAWRNKSVTTLDEALAQADTWLFEGFDVYYAMARYTAARVWNPVKLDWKSKKPGAWEQRTQANVKHLKCFFMDIDIDADDPKKYPTQKAALVALRSFCTVVKLPTPTIVDSGYGWHVYWLLDADLPRDEWVPIAEKLKAVAIVAGLLADHRCTADCARVLRIPGSANFKRGCIRAVTVVLEGTPVAATVMDDALSAYVLDKGVPVKAPKVHRVAAGGMPKAVADANAAIEGNIGATNDPLNPAAIAFGCAAFAKQIISRGANASEPMWRAALGVALFCEPAQATMLAVSDGHPGFTVPAMQAKVVNWSKGPSLCTSFWQNDSVTCEACPHWRSITSPAALGREIREAESPKVQIASIDADGVVTEEEAKFVSPPEPYRRKERTDAAGKVVRINGTGDPIVDIVVVSEDTDGKKTFEVILPYDLYPVRILRQTGADGVVQERGMWRIHLPRVGPIDMQIPNTLMSDSRRLHARMLDEGAHINPEHAKHTQFYMSAYLQKMSAEQDREKVYERLGWHDDYRTFVTVDRSFHRDGSITEHNPSPMIQSVTKDAMHKRGSLDLWKQSLKFYEGPGNEYNRVMGMFAMGAPLLHMTGHKGVLVAASGESGRGKTTSLELGSSMWGDPEPLLISGGSSGTTMNAFYAMLGTYHSLPVFWDDTTERDVVEMREMMINISQGKTKERMLGHEHDNKTRRWETMVLSSANTDDVSRIMASSKESEANLMRMISIEFNQMSRDVDSKIRADKFKRSIRDNYGHVGPLLMQYVTKNYDKVKAAVIANVEKFDRMLKIESHERFWSAGIACAYTAAQIAFALELWPFDPKLDLDWITKHVGRMRESHIRSVSTAVDTLGQFLEQHIGHTLVLSMKGTSNVDNIAVTPHGALFIRHEVDIGLIYVARSAMLQYCAESGANFRKLENELHQQGIVTGRNVHKVLGSGTPYAKAQTRCWMISATALSQAN